MIKNGWNILFFRLFNEQYNQLVLSVNELRERMPQGYKHHRKTKLLVRIHSAIFKTVPQNPKSQAYIMTKVLNGALRHWRRVKGGLPDRYRLFFKFQSSDKNIIYAWMNDESCLRKDGDKRDVYRVFKKLVDNGEIPEEYCDLMEASFKPN